MSIGPAVVAPELLDAVERALPGVKTSEGGGLFEPSDRRLIERLQRNCSVDH
jgi:hypothetical protein